MKKFAQLDSNNKVLNILVAKEDFNNSGFVEYTDSNPAFIGGDYFDGMFYAPQPFESWTRNNGAWVPPIPMPDIVVTDGPPKFYQWDEAAQSWIISVSSLTIR